MENPSYIALSGQVARERQMDVLSNNIANVSTTAFKAQRMIFAEYLAGASDGTKLSYVQDAGTARDFSQGPMTQTGSQLDIALQGTGFLEIQTAQGIRYSRDGRMKIDSTGALVTLDGDPVLGQGDQPITLPDNRSTISIGQDGTISTLDGSVGRFAVVDFDNVQRLSAETNGLYSTDQLPVADTETKVMQGMVEESNVKPIVEITRLMNASHQFGAAKSFQDGESDRHKNAIDRLAKVV